MIDYFLLIFRILVFPGFTFILFLTLFCDWLERKLEARIQNRVGPMVAGPAGILQPLADFIKLLTKEDIEPRDTKKLVFRFAPLTAFSIMMFAMCFLPIDGASVLSSGGFTGDLIIILAFSTIANFLLFLAGWASSNPYGTIGSARVLTQFLGYDIPLFLLALSPAFIAGSITISQIANAPLPFILLSSMGVWAVHNHPASRAGKRPVRRASLRIRVGWRFRNRVHRRQTGFSSLNTRRPSCFWFSPGC